jgi:hypothetical protein
MSQIRSYLEFSFLFGDGPIFTHQTGNTMLTTKMNFGIQLHIDSSAPIIFTALLLMIYFNLHQ